MDSSTMMLLASLGINAMAPGQVQTVGRGIQAAPQQENPLKKALQLGQLGMMGAGMFGGGDTFMGLEDGVPMYETTRNLGGGLNLQQAMDYNSAVNPYLGLR